MKAILLRVRGALRRQWRSSVAVACIVAFGSGAVLTLAAGARRTGAAPDAYTAAVGGDADGSVQQESGPPLTREVAALLGVKSVQAMTFAFAAVVDTAHKSAIDTLTFTGTQPFSSRLVAGRDTDPTKPHEFIADTTFAAAHHAHVGDRFPVVSWTREQGAHGQGFNAKPNGPAFEGVLVGIIDTPDKLQDASSVAVFSPALLDQDVGIVTTLMAVRLRAGATTKQLRSELDGLPNGTALSLDRGPVIGSEIRNAVDAQPLGTWLMAGVMGIAALVALGQLLTRHSRLPEAERRPLAAVGFTRRQLMAESVTRAAVPAVVGIALGAIIAVAASGQFPAGFVSDLEPKPGLRVDVRTLGAAGGLLLLGLLAWVGVASLSQGRNRVRRSPSTTSDAITRAVADPAASTGARFALTSLNGSVAGALLTLALIVAGIVGTTGFAVSLDRLVSDRGRTGSNYAFAVGDNSDLTASDLRKGLKADPDIAGMMILTEGSARAGKATVQLVGVEQVRGDLAPRLTSGRLPAAPDEVALGRVTARALYVGVGDNVDLSGSRLRASYHVVGVAVVPTIAGTDGVGTGGVVTAGGLLRLEPHPTAAMAAIVLRHGAPATARTRIGRRVGAQPGPESVPAVILNVARVRRIPGFLAALLAALLLLTMLHTVIVSVQSRRRDLAVLRALGADRRWIGRVVHWQTSVLAATPLLIGVPLGLVAGSAVFRVFAGRIGAFPEPALPLALVASMIAALVVAANLVAVAPTRRARRLSTAQLLRAD